MIARCTKNVMKLSDCSADSRDSGGYSRVSTSWMWYSGFFIHFALIADTLISVNASTNWKPPRLSRGGGQLKFDSYRRPMASPEREPPSITQGRSEEGHLMLDHVSHHGIDPADLLRFPGGEVYQGEERDPYGSKVHGEKAELRGATFLGKRGLCTHRVGVERKR